MKDRRTQIIAEFEKNLEDSIAFFRSQSLAPCRMPTLTVKGGMRFMDTASWNALFTGFTNMFISIWMIFTKQGRHETHFSKRTFERLNLFWIGATL